MDLPEPVPFHHGFVTVKHIHYVIYHSVVIFSLLSFYCSLSLQQPLYFYSILLFAISSLNIYLGIICSFDEAPLEAGFPNCCDISRQLSNKSCRQQAFRIVQMLSLYVPTFVAVYWHTPSLSTPFIYSSLFCPASFPGLSVGS